MYWKILILLCITALFNSSCFIGEKTFLKITNMSTADISNISVLYRGGNHNYLLLRKGESISLKITPTGESSITIEYEEGVEKYTKDLDVYIEPMSNDIIEVLIHTNGEISRKTTRRPSIYDGAIVIGMTTKGFNHGLHGFSRIREPFSCVQGFLLRS